MTGLAYEAWESRRAKELKEALRENPELLERAKALGVWKDTIAEIEAESVTGNLSLTEVSRDGDAE